MTGIKGAVDVANTTAHSAELLTIIFSPIFRFLLLGFVEDAELRSNWSFTSFILTDFDMLLFC
jgi:hypothetical protein